MRYDAIVKEKLFSKLFSIIQTINGTKISLCISGFIYISNEIANIEIQSMS